MDENRPHDLANHKLSPCSENVSLNYRHSLQHVMTGDQYDTISFSVPMPFKCTIFTNNTFFLSHKININQKACPFSNKMNNLWCC